MQEGIRRNLTPTKMFLPKVVEQIDNVLTDKVQDSPLYKPFVEMNAAVAKADQENLGAEARQIIKDRVYPAFAKLKDFFKKDYIPAARESIAWTNLPNGVEWYAFLVRAHTTTSRTPDELHQVGLNEVARINGEMQKIMKGVGYKGSMKAFNDMLLTDSRFYFTSEEDLLRTYRDITKRIDPELIHMFKTLPRLTYGVRPRPRSARPRRPEQNINPALLETGRAGLVSKPTPPTILKTSPDVGDGNLGVSRGGSRPPSTRRQLRKKSRMFPSSRKFGWKHSLCRRLGPLCGNSAARRWAFTKTPTHASATTPTKCYAPYVAWSSTPACIPKGWSRQRGDRLLPRADADASEEDARVEIDRFPHRMAGPSARLQSRSAQNPQRAPRPRHRCPGARIFDVRAFHDVVLGQGPLPMDVLESIVDQWIHDQQKTKKKAV